jgi:outer membrane murein-binding lipoprotein Lpp
VCYNPIFQLETRIQELNGVIGELDKELKEFYPKLKAAKGSSQNYYKQRVMMLMRKRKM